MACGWLELLASILTVYPMIMPFDNFEYHVHIFENIYGKWSICSFGANAPFSIIFSEVLKLYLNFS